MASPSTTHGDAIPAIVDDDTTSATQTAELTAKQVRELRRLCRKTANRAEYDDRSVQVRQIASILAMGTPCLQQFAPECWNTGSALQAWVDRVRGDGADWRDERILLRDAVQELRDWDRLLKIWARKKFVTLDAQQDESEHVAHKDRLFGAELNENCPEVNLECASQSKTPLQKRSSLTWINSSPVSASASPAPSMSFLEDTPAPVSVSVSMHSRSDQSRIGTPTTPKLKVYSDTSRPKLVPASIALTSSPVVADEDTDEERRVSTEFTRHDMHSDRLWDACRKQAASRNPLANLSLSRQANAANTDDIPRRHSMRRLGRTGKRETTLRNLCTKEPHIIHVPELSDLRNSDKENTAVERDWTALRKNSQSKHSSPQRLTRTQSSIIQ